MRVFFLLYILCVNFVNASVGISFNGIYDWFTVSGTSQELAQYFSKDPIEAEGITKILEKMKSSDRAPFVRHFKNLVAPLSTGNEAVVSNLIYLKRDDWDNFLLFSNSVFQVINDICDGFETLSDPYQDARVIANIVSVKPTDRGDFLSYLSQYLKYSYSLSDASWIVRSLVRMEVHNYAECSRFSKQFLDDSSSAQDVSDVLFGLSFIKKGDFESVINFSKLYIEEPNFPRGKIRMIFSAFAQIDADKRVNFIETVNPLLKKVNAKDFDVLTIEILSISKNREEMIDFLMNIDWENKDKKYYYETVTRLRNLPQDKWKNIYDDIISGKCKF